MSKKRYSEMTSQERFDLFVEKGSNPFENGRGFCHDCGAFPGYQPRVLVANLKTETLDKYLLDLPPYCDNCVKERGLTRYGYLVPKTEEFQNFTEACERFTKEDLPDWVAKMQEKSIKEISEGWGVTKEEAKEIMGYD